MSLLSNRAQDVKILQLHLMIQIQPINLTGTCSQIKQLPTTLLRNVGSLSARGDEFALIPICYPSTPDDLDLNAWRNPTPYTSLLGDPRAHSGDTRFYGFALLSSLSVLKWILKALYAAGPELVTIYPPDIAVEDYPVDGFTLNHLKAMYPSLDIERLTDDIHKKDKDASVNGSGIRRHILDPLTEFDEQDDVLRKDAWKLLQIIRHELDQRIQEEKIFDQLWKRPHPFGLSAGEIFSLGERFRWPLIKTSALFDILIDDCHLVTDITKSDDDDGVCRWKRVFAPDGEMVSGLVRLYTIQRGLPDGF